MSSKDMDVIQNKINLLLEENLSKYGNLFILGSSSNKSISKDFDDMFFIDVFRHREGMDCVGFRILTKTNRFDFHTLAIKDDRKRDISMKSLLKTIGFVCEHKENIIRVINKCINEAIQENYTASMKFVDFKFSISFHNQHSTSITTVYSDDKKLEFINVAEVYHGLFKENLETKYFLSENYKLML